MVHLFVSLVDGLYFISIGLALGIRPQKPWFAVLVPKSFLGHLKEYGL